MISICCVFIWKAGDGFMVGSNYLGRNLSQGVRGASINAIASSLPELFTSFFFLFFLKEADGFAGGIGTTTGSAVYNSMIIPSASVLVVIYMGLARKVKISRPAMMRDGITLLAVEIIFLFIISKKVLHWYHGLILVAIYVVYLTYMFWTMKRTEGVAKEETVLTQAKEIQQKSRFLTFLKAIATMDLTALILRKKTITTISALSLLIISSTLMAIMCYLLVVACQWIGSETYQLPWLGTFMGLDIPVIFVALILAAAASSIPDTLISIKDARDGKYDDAISNAFGSNIFAICLALGFPLLIFTAINGPLPMMGEAAVQILELSFLLLILTIVVVALFISTNALGKTRSFALIGLYAVFFLYIIGKSRGNPLAEEISGVILAFLEAIGIL